MTLVQESSEGPYVWNLFTYCFIHLLAQSLPLAPSASRLGPSSFPESLTTWERSNGLQSINSTVFPHMSQSNGLQVHREWSSLADFPLSHSFTVHYLMLVTNPVFSPLWTRHKSDGFQSVCKLECLTDSALDIELVVTPVSSQCVLQLMQKEFGSQSCSSECSQASPLHDSSLRRKVALCISASLRSLS